MCLKLSKTANSIADVRKLFCDADRSSARLFARNDARSFEHTLRAASMLHSRMPRRKPLYWKWMWSTIRRPGWVTIEAARICAVAESGLKDLRAQLSKWKS